MALRLCHQPFLPTLPVLLLGSPGPPQFCTFPPACRSIPQPLIPCQTAGSGPQLPMITSTVSVSRPRSSAATPACLLALLPLSSGPSQFCDSPPANRLTSAPQALPDSWTSSTAVEGYIVCLCILALELCPHHRDMLNPLPKAPPKTLGPLNSMPSNLVTAHPQPLEPW